MLVRSDNKCGDEESSIGGNVIDEQVRESLQNSYGWCLLVLDGG